MSAHTRDPESSAKTTLKGGVLGGLITFGIAQLFPDIGIESQGAATTIGITVGIAVGTELRNFTHSFEPGGKRAGQDTGWLGFVLALVRIIGKFLI